jgi:hypothetical protein
LCGVWSMGPRHEHKEAVETEFIDLGDIATFVCK